LLLDNAPLPGDDPVDSLATVSRRGAQRAERNMSRSTVFILLAVLAIGTERAWALANPASVFCVQNGGKSEIRNGARGQYGVCRLPDGRVVNEWSYYRKMKDKARSSQ
jgi:putative hemolysin